MSVPRSLDTLTLKQLLKEQVALSKAIERRVEEAEKSAPTLEAEAVTLINSLVAKMGFPPAKTAVSVSFPQNGNGAHKAPTTKAKGRKPRKGKIAIKYRNPSNPAETWSGRGRPARWLAALEKQGNKRDQYAVR